MWAYRLRPDVSPPNELLVRPLTQDAVHREQHVGEHGGADQPVEVQTRPSGERGLAQLTPASRGLGLRLPFDPGGVDFSCITKEERLYICEALHWAIIAVDEMGTARAAATAIMAMPVSGGEGPETMTLDRPFIFAIQERETGTILVLGRMTDPQSRRGEERQRGGSEVRLSGRGGAGRGEGPAGFPAGRGGAGALRGPLGGRRALRGRAGGRGAAREHVGLRGGSCGRVTARHLCRRAGSASSHF